MPKPRAPPLSVLPYRKPSPAAIRGADGDRPNELSLALGHSRSVVRIPLAESIEKTVPVSLLPPLDVVPHKRPVPSVHSAALGRRPLLLGPLFVNSTIVVNSPETTLILKTVPKSPAPPALV